MAGSKKDVQKMVRLGEGLPELHFPSVELMCEGHSLQNLCPACRIVHFLMLDVSEVGHMSSSLLVVLIRLAPGFHSAKHAHSSAVKATQKKSCSDQPGDAAGWCHGAVPLELKCAARDDQKRSDTSVRQAAGRRDLGFCFHAGVMSAAGLKPARARALLSLEGDSTGQDSATPVTSHASWNQTRRSRAEPMQMAHSVLPCFATANEAGLSDIMMQRNGCGNMARTCRLGRLS